MGKFFFDVTDIVRYIESETTISGIQRVSLEVIKRMIVIHGADNVMISTWDMSQNQYVAMDAQFLLAMDEFDADGLSTVFFGKKARDADTVPPLLTRYRNKPHKYYFHRTRANIEAIRGNERYFERRGTTLAKWPEDKANARKTAKERAQGGRPAHAYVTNRTPITQLLSSGDRVVILGATWGMDAMNANFVELKEKYQVEFSLFVHDLIPLIAPEHIAADFSLIFYRWLEQSMQYCSHYFVNSQNTGRDLQIFMDEIGEQRPFDVIPLAQALSTQDVKDTSGDQPLKRKAQEIAGLNRYILNLTKIPYVLVVGTIESRKNLWRLAQAWERLAQDRDIEVPKLLFAGKMGWFIDDIRNWLSATGNLNGWVEIAEKPTDRELHFLYKHCEFTVMVSHYEGWGLPIGEGLSFGKTGVVADNSSMPEVGGDMVEYCDAKSIDSIYAACRKLIADPEHRASLEAKIAETQLRTWDDVAADLVRVMDH